LENKSSLQVSRLVFKVIEESNTKSRIQESWEDQVEALGSVIEGLKENFEELGKGRVSELQAKLGEQTAFMTIMVDQKLQRDLKDAVKKREHREETREYQEKWRKWVEKEAQLKAGKAMSTKRKKWQAKGKALPIEMVPNATQTQPEEEMVKPIPVMVEASMQTVERRQEEGSVQTKGDVLEQATKRKKNRNKGIGKEEKKEKDTARKGSHEDPHANKYQEYEDLSSYEEEDEILVVEPPVTKKNRLLDGQRQRLGINPKPAKKPLRSPSPNNDTLVKAIVVHGIPCQRPLADLAQDVGPGGIMGACWLLGGARRLGKTTSSVGIFFDKKLAGGTHLKVKGRWHPTDAYDFDRGRRRVELSDW